MRNHDVSNQRGQATIELIALLPLLMLVAMLAVQMQVFVSTATAAENAARNAARVASRGGDPVTAASASLSPGQRADLAGGGVKVIGEKVVVELGVPLVHDGFGVRVGTISRSATFAG